MFWIVWCFFRISFFFIIQLNVPLKRIRLWRSKRKRKKARKRYNFNESHWNIGPYVLISRPDQIIARIMKFEICPKQQIATHTHTTDKYSRKETQSQRSDDCRPTTAAAAKKNNIWKKKKKYQTHHFPNPFARNEAKCFWTNLKPLAEQEHWKLIGFLCMVFRYVQLIYTHGFDSYNRFGLTIHTETLSPATVQMATENERLLH